MRTPKAVAEYSRKEDFAPSAMDLHVGARIKARRFRIGMTRDSLAAEIGVGKQAVQRYEEGAVRISVGRLADIGKVLRIAPSWFLEEYPGSSLPTNGDPMMTLMTKSADGIAMLNAFLRVPKAQQRALLSICEAMAGDAPPVIYQEGG